MGNNLHVTCFKQHASVSASTVAAQCFAAISEVCIMIAVMLAFAYLTYPKKGRSSLLTKVYAGSCICSCKIITY